MIRTHIFPSAAVVAAIALGWPGTARAEHTSTLGSSVTIQQAVSNPSSMGQSLQMPTFQKRDGGGGGGGGGPKYQPNPTTKELAKAAQGYQQQMNDATKSEMSSVKDMTSSFLSSLDKLKVPEAGGDMLKQAADNIAQIGKDDGDLNKKVDDLIAATKAQGDNQVEYIKAVAQRFSPNGGPPQPRVQKTAGMPSIAQLIQQYSAGRGNQGGTPLGNAMGAAVTGSGRPGSAIGGGGAAPSSRRSYNKSDSPSRIYNLPPGVAFDE